MRESREITDETLYGKRSNQFKQMQGWDLQKIK